jgi:ribonuclease Z
VGLLALTHLSPRHPAGALRAEARELFERTIVPRDFDRVDLPLPEKGEPVHVRADDDPALAGSRTTQ